MNRAQKFAASFLAAASTSVIAATNPPLPTVSQSTGDIVITVDKGHAMQISELDDIYAGVHQSSATIVPVFEQLCVYGTNPAGYTVQADSANVGGGFDGFRMQNGGFYVSYFVGWSDTSGSANLVSGVQSGIFSGNSPFVNCGAVGTVNTTISATVEATTFDAAPTALYTDTLTLLVVSQ